MDKEARTTLRIGVAFSAVDSIRSLPCASGGACVVSKGWNSHPVELFNGTRYGKRRMKSDSEIWLQERAEKVLREVGIRKDQTVLDFGCGSGYYAIPAARIVGDKGKVYALDKDGNRLSEVMQRAERLKLNSIRTIETSGEVKIALEDESVDVTLLYDVIHSYYFSTDERKGLLTEVYRVSRPNALVSVYPKHMDLDYIRREIEAADFRFSRKLSVTLLHYHTLVQDHILNFRRT